MFHVPPKIADCRLPALPEETADVVAAASVRLPDRATMSPAGLATEKLLLRLEAIGSARIEEHHTDFRKLVLAEAGAEGSPDDKLVARHAQALRSIADCDSFCVSQKALLDVHRTIMDGEYFAGRFRGQNEHVQVGGYVAPIPDLVEGLVADWVEFATRSESDFVSHIAVAHSQFESIHPFCDGNGRSGRAEMTRMLLVAGKLAVPFSVALFEARRRYYDTFGAYRQGDLEYPVRVHAAALAAAAESANRHIGDMEALLDEWRDEMKSNGDHDAAAEKALMWVAQNPAFTEEMLAEGAGAADGAGAAEGTGAAEGNSTIEKLASAMIISGHPDLATTAKRPIWESHEIHDLAEKIEKTAQDIAASTVSKIRHNEAEF